MQNIKPNKIDYNGIVADIEDILLDPSELNIYSESWSDEDGRHESHDFYSTTKQREQIVELLRKFCIGVLETYVNNMFATEDAKEIHYK